MSAISQVNTHCARAALPDAHRPIPIRVEPVGGRRSVDARSARRDDAEFIATMLNTWAGQGLTIARSVESVRISIGEFVVAVQDDERASEILACGALIAHSPALGEIRSVASTHAAAGTGAGSEVVRFLIEQAESIRMDGLVLLTKVPGFFARFGFHEILPASLPTDFVQDQINARGRTFEGRVVMRRQLSMS